MSIAVAPWRLCVLMHDAEHHMKRNVFMCFHALMAVRSDPWQMPLNAIVCCIANHRCFNVPYSQNIVIGTVLLKYTDHNVLHTTSPFSSLQDISRWCDITCLSIVHFRSQKSTRSCARNPSLRSMKSLTRISHSGELTVANQVKLICCTGHGLLYHSSFDRTLCRHFQPAWISCAWDAFQEVTKRKVSSPKSCMSSVCLYY